MSPWQYMMDGRFEEAMLAYSALCDEKPRAFNLHNLGLAFLNLGDWASALLQFQRAENVSVEGGTIGDARRKFIGTVHWLAGDREQAANVWADLLADHAAGTIAYTDAAGGVVAPCLAWFAGQSLGRPVQVESSFQFLDKRLGTKPAHAWPGAIGHFILGRLSDGDLFIEAGRSERLRKRHLCKAAFWAGVGAGVAGKEQKANELLHFAAGSGALQEVEYYLARHEYGQRTRPRT